MCVHIIIVCVFKLITVYSVPTSIPVKWEPGPVSFLQLYSYRFELDGVPLGQVRRDGEECVVRVQKR